MEERKPDWWYINDEGEKQGPFTLDEMRSFCEQGLLNLKTKVHKPGSEDWKMLGDFPGLANLVPYEAPEVDEEAAMKKWLEDPFRPRDIIQRLDEELGEFVEFDIPFKDVPLKRVGIIIGLFFVVFVLGAMKWKSSGDMGQLVFGFLATSAALSAMGFFIYYGFYNFFLMLKNDDEVNYWKPKLLSTLYVAFPLVIFLLGVFIHPSTDSGKNFFKLITWGMGVAVIYANYLLAFKAVASYKRIRLKFHLRNERILNTAPFKLSFFFNLLAWTPLLRLLAMLFSIWSYMEMSGLLRDLKDHEAVRRIK